ncbi:hypothetical protein BD410DRAFT_744627 [Rickenella mellea]|uniref:Zn(2)-C6 fungal-type domain-containing protein n=1 Tax=Rickenella mellea TaxID=50990 RepID=A0A4Y7QBU3_9AGAM|nr:hypothetical protein BD410DRAFT_744627 [Rickenella mellea]
MPTPPINYNQYFIPPQHSMPYQNQMSQQHDGGMPPPMQPSQSPPMQMDPSLSLYQPSFYPYPQQQQQQQQQQAIHPHMNMAHSSPSSQGSESLGTPPADSVSSSSRQSNNLNGKRSSSNLNGSAGNNRKKLRRDDADEDEDMSPAADKDEGKVKATRGSRACTVCRRLKMKCVGAEQGPPCKRCLSGNHECIFEESNRGKRSTNVRKHEQLTRSLRKMERTLDTVLRSINNPGLTSLASGMASRSPSPDRQTATTQALMASPSPPPQSAGGHHHVGSPRLHSLPDNALNPLGLLAEASLANRRIQTSSGSPMLPPLPGAPPNDPQKVGVANDVYFKPGPMTILPLRRLYIERQVQPEMLSFVSTDEVVDLFKIYFDHINPHCNLLDRNFHTPSLVCSRSPFLLTTICAISSKFYEARSELHPRLTNMAKKLAFSVPEQGYKSIEIVQAYLLLTLWGCGPVERYEQDKTWLLLGMAIRMGTDLNLHRKSTTSGGDTPEARARNKEIRNRERTWLLCFVLDRSASAQMGKPHSIKEDSIIRNASTWWEQPYAIPTDVGISAYSELQRIISRSLELLYSGTTTPSGLQTGFDYYLVIKTIEAQLLAWKHEWEGKATTSMEDYPSLIGHFYLHYAMLVINSFGLQNALDRAPIDISHFFARCHSSATACAILVRDELGPRGYLRYSPDSHFVQCSYAVLSLLKLVRPEFQAFIGNEQNTFNLVKDVADLLERIAVGPLHTPALYSTFLRALISARTDESTRPSSPRPELSNNNGMRGDSSNSETNALNGQGAQAHGDGGLGLLNTGYDGASTPADFHFNSEMGPVADISTFPPTMAPMNGTDDTSGMLSMDSILSAGFWDSVLVPGYSGSLEGLSGGFVYGAGGSGLITSRLGTPLHSGSNTPMPGSRSTPITQSNLNAAFETSPGDGLKVGS